MADRNTHMGDEQDLQHKRSLTTDAPAAGKCPTMGVPRAFCTCVGCRAPVVRAHLAGCRCELCKDLPPFQEHETDGT